jgi:putative membrane protein
VQLTAIEWVSCWRTALSSFIVEGKMICEIGSFEGIQMIRNFGDHSANERTFLAWVRTSIGVIAFGFLVARFDLYLSIMAPQALQNKITVPTGEFGHVAGLVLIVLGIAIMLVAAYRFARTAREIDDEKLIPGTGSRIDLALAGLLAILATGLLVYLAHTLTAKA